MGCVISQWIHRHKEIRSFENPIYGCDLSKRCISELFDSLLRCTGVVLATFLQVKANVFFPLHELKKNWNSCLLSIDSCVYGMIQPTLVSIHKWQIRPHTYVIHHHYNIFWRISKSLEKKDPTASNRCVVAQLQDMMYDVAAKNYITVNKNITTVKFWFLLAVPTY